jgi:hypothetical protein
MRASVRLRAKADLAGDDRPSVILPMLDFVRGFTTSGTRCAGTTLKCNTAKPVGVRVSSSASRQMGPAKRSHRVNTRRICRARGDVVDPNLPIGRYLRPHSAHSGASWGGCLWPHGYRRGNPLEYYSTADRTFVRFGTGRSAGRCRKYRASASAGERNSTLEKPAPRNFASSISGSK